VDTDAHIQETSGYIDVGSRQLYATVFAPADLSARPPLVMVEPFGEEKKCAFRLLVRLARACARVGTPVVRFDLWGTGESPGTHADATWSMWLDDTKAVAAFATQQWQHGWVGLGARLGALLAAEAAGDAHAARLICLEPVVDGAEALRDLERRQKIKDMMAGAQQGTDDKTADERWADGETVDFGGFEIGPDLARELGTRSLTTLLDQLPDSCAVSAVRVSGSQKLPPAWGPLVDRAAAVPPGRVAIVKDQVCGLLDALTGTSDDRQPQAES
jgi:pimeloyl-ACP methyl ester carboxylesterase